MISCSLIFVVLLMDCKWRIFMVLQVDEHSANCPRKSCDANTSYFVCRSFDGREFKPLSVQQVKKQESIVNTPTSRFGRAIKTSSKLTDDAVASPASAADFIVEGACEKVERAAKNERSSHKKLFGSGKKKDRDRDQHVLNSKSPKSSASNTTHKTGGYCYTSVQSIWIHQLQQAVMYFQLLLSTV
jgi:hypothetical protein